MADDNLILTDAVVQSVLAAIVAASKAPGGAKPTVFAKFDGIDGESTNSKYAKNVELIYFKELLSQPTSTGYTSAQGSGTTGRAVFGPCIMAATVSAATPKFLLAAANGDKIAKVTVGFVIPTGKEMTEYMQVELAPVTIVGHVLSEPAGAGKAFEILALIAGKVNWSHGSVKTSFNFQTGGS